jgi:uncharacterized protein YecE (DUF72 family)
VGVTRAAALRIGCSGYEYDHWRGVLYPEGLPRRAWLEHYATVFDTVEINNTFYRLPESRTFDAWRERVPSSFLFAVKLSRYGTHRKHLADPATWVPTFVERAEHLGPALGPILVQLPPRWRARPDRLEEFLAVAPAAHRWAVEVRDPSWLRDDVYEVLARHDAALCIHDLVEHHPHVVTASWMYLRFHGPRRDGPYSGAYTPQALSAAAGRIRTHLAAGRDVFAYFNNDLGGHAVHDAATLRRYLTGRPARDATAAGASEAGSPRLT